MAQAAVTALRLYGVAAVESGQATSLTEGTTLVHYRALAAIVEPTTYSVSSLPEEETDRYLRVLEEAYEHSAVLPAPPGTVFQSQSTLTRWLELHYFTLTEALSVIEGHSAARVSISAHSPADNGDGEAHKSFAALAAESLRLLRSQAAATVTLPKADGDEEDGIVARASFLVDSQRWQTFKDTVTKEAQRQSALDFRVTGPWPPYDFVRMQFGG
ncbi:MAG TPA: GvpL/GvpF family gas vesicle protein [Gemmatimonadaceae bacterium]|nr:GvpL/GvpF family gas vesicle protein [Gemmatimonadaceae bacterium]